MYVVRNGRAGLLSFIVVGIHREQLIALVDETDLFTSYEKGFLQKLPYGRKALKVLKVEGHF